MDSFTHFWSSILRYSSDSLKKLSKKPTPTIPTPPTTVPVSEEVAGVEELRIKAKEVASIEAISKLAKEEPQKVAKIISSWLKAKT